MSQDSGWIDLHLHMMNMTKYRAINEWIRSFLLVLVLTSCGAAQPAWRENAPVNLPHTAASIQGVTLTIDAVNSRLKYRIECATIDTYGNVTLEVKLNPAPAAPIVTVRDIACMHEQQLIAEGAIPLLDARQIGDTVIFAFSAEANPLRQGIATQDAVYMVGSNGSLHAGAGSVWREK